MEVERSSRKGRQRATTHDGRLRGPIHAGVADVIFGIQAKHRWNLRSLLPPRDDTLQEGTDEIGILAGLSKRGRQGRLGSHELTSDRATNRVYAVEAFSRAIYTTPHTATQTHTSETDCQVGLVTVKWGW